ncbi:MAG: response regulator, partial [Spirochaetes bacterium]|nr:response regulator [Spirochaetota bacterium]
KGFKMSEKNLNLMIIDDDLDYLLQKKIELEGEGFTVKTAENRKKAHELLESFQPDVAIVDLMIEDMDDGFVLSYELKKKFPNMPVIMVTAVTNYTGLEFESVTSAEKSWIKADTILTKPVRIEQLVREIERLT